MAQDARNLNALPAMLSQRPFLAQIMAPAAMSQSASVISSSQLLLSVPTMVLVVWNPSALVRLPFRVNLLARNEGSSAMNQSAFVSELFQVLWFVRIMVLGVRMVIVSASLLLVLIMVQLVGIHDALVNCQLAPNMGQNAETQGVLADFLLVPSTDLNAGTQDALVGLLLA